MDGTIPRKKLPYVLKRMAEMSEQYGLRVANVFHAGDGNLHPLIMYDANKPGELERTEEFGAEILKLCVEVGGVLTGEHGVGVEKRDLMPVQFGEDDLNQQQRVKCAFDPTQILNPGKVFPKLHRCAELGRMHVHRGEVRFPGSATLLVAWPCPFGSLKIRKRRYGSYRRAVNSAFIFIVSEVTFSLIPVFPVS